MANKGIKGKIKIETYEDLLGGDLFSGKGDIKEVSLNELHEFKNHPFHVVDDEKMEELVESIKEKGVLSPAIVRQRENGGYEIISGHRRRRACELAKLETMPVIIKNLDDDEATILMVDANIQRENILPSERAFSLQMKMNALKHQGMRTDLTSGQVGPKLASDEIGEENGISGRQVKRYVCLTKLLPEILDKVDAGKIGFVPAVELSFIGEDEQKWISAVLSESNKSISLNQATLLRNEYKSKTLTEEVVCKIIIGEKKNDRKVILNESDLSEFFPKEMDSKEIKKKILSLLEQRKEDLKDG